MCNVVRFSVDKARGLEGEVSTVTVTAVSKKISVGSTTFDLCYAGIQQCTKCLGICGLGSNSMGRDGA